MTEPPLVSARIDALTAAFDDVRARLGLTNGEGVVFATLLFAGTLAEANDREVLTLAIGFVLGHLSGRDAAHQRAPRLALLRTCAVESLDADPC